MNRFTKTVQTTISAEDAEVLESYGIQVAEDTVQTIKFVVTDLKNQKVDYYLSAGEEMFELFDHSAHEDDINLLLEEALSEFLELDLEEQELILANLAFLEASA